MGRFARLPTHGEHRALPRLRQPRRAPLRRLPRAALPPIPALGQGPAPWLRCSRGVPFLAATSVACRPPWYSFAKRYNRTFAPQNSLRLAQMATVRHAIEGNASSAYHLATIGLTAGWRASLASRRQPSVHRPRARDALSPAFFPENQAPIAARGVGRYTRGERPKVAQGGTATQELAGHSEQARQASDNTAINQGVLDERGSEAKR